MQVVLSDNNNTSTILAKIRNRKQDYEGTIIGKSNNNPILDTRTYELKYPDGPIEK